MKSKIIVSLIIFVLMFEMSAVFATETVQKHESITNTEEYRLLSALGIITDEFKDYDSASDIVTREEAAIYLAKMYNLEIDLNASAEYVDVEAYRLSSAYIDFAQKMGLFENMDRRRFRPSDPISYNEIAIMASRILGFDKMYGITADYPGEYYNQAQKSGIFRGVTGKNEFSRKDFIKIVVNILNADICTQVSFGENVEFVIETGNSLLKSRFEVIKARGIVTGYGFINMYGNTEVEPEKIAIDGEYFRIAITGETDYTMYVGHSVEYYLDIYQEDYKSVVFIEKLKNSMEISLDGEYVNADSNTTSISYETEEGRNKKLTLSNNAKVFFNGNNFGRFTADMAKKIQNTEISIKMIDNNEDYVYDVIFIYQYETYVVDDVNIGKKRIYLKYDKIINGNKYISLDESDDYKVMLLVNGLPAKLEQLRVDNVLSCIPSYDNGKLMNLIILVSKRTVTGVVDEVTEDKLVINSNKYRRSSHYKEIAGLFPDAPNVKLGSEGRFFLDVIGNIAAVKLNKNIYYGYFKKLYKKNITAFGDEYGVEIYDETGVWFEGDLANTITLDGKRMKRNACVTELTQSGSFESQVIRFSISNDQIVMIDTLQVGNSDPEYDILELKDIYHASMGTDYGNITGRYYRFINQSWFMTLPENKDKKDRYSVISRHGFAEGQTVYLKVYGIDEFNTVTFCVFDYSDLTGVESYENYVMVVNRVSSIVNSDEETVQRVYGYYARGGWGSGEMRDAVLDEAESGVFQNVKKGDVLMFKLDSGGKAISAKAAFTLEEAKTSAPFHKNSTLKDETSFGTILKVDASRMLLLMDINGTTQVFWFGAVAAYDMNTDTIIKISPKDLTPGKKVFNWGYWNLPFLTLMYIE